MHATQNQIRHFARVSKSVIRIVFISFLLIIINSCILNAVGQDNNALQTKLLTDTTAILKMIAQGEYQMENMPEASFQSLSEALHSSEVIQYYKGIGMASERLGHWYFGNNLNMSIQMGNNSIRAYERTSTTSVDELAKAHLLLAEAYDEAGKKDSSAYYYYLLGSEMTEGNLTDPEFAVVVFTKLSIFWINVDNDISNNKSTKETIKRFVNKAREASVKIKDTANGRTTVYFVEGAYYHATKKFDSARYFYNSYLIEREKKGLLSTSRKISTLSNIADTYLQEGNTQKSLQYLQQIRDMAKNPEQKKYLAFYMSFIDLQTAKAYFQQKKYKECISILDTALVGLGRTGSHLRNEVVEAYDTYASCYEALGNYKKALEYKNIYVKLNDSLTRKDKIDIISRLEIRNRIAEKDKELALQKLNLSEVKNKIRDKNSWIIGISLLTLSGILIFALWRKKNISKQKLQEERISNLQQKINIERLKASINAEERERTRIGRELHDGIGGLLSVARMNFELAKKANQNQTNKDFADGLQMLEEATVELRKAAYNLMPEVLLTQGLASAVQAFCEKMASKSNTNITFQAIGQRKEVSTTFDLSIYRIIQELLHNVIKHAHASHALVQINFHEEGSTNITIEDDGIGLPADAFINSKGMGLKNMKERVNDLGGKLDIQSTPETGTSIYLEFDSWHNNENSI